MKIESVEVIPMRGESIWEDVKEAFDVSCITTSYDKWKEYSDNQFKMYESMDETILYDEECDIFARKQKAYMLGPVGIFGHTLYEAMTRESDSLDGVVLNGPLLSIIKVSVDDISKEKTEYRENYFNKKTFQIESGLWYPQKTLFKLRFGRGIPRAS